ncbi:MAG: hypothetical protein MUC88_00555 [Planctomycetes bacterium]|jgi:hypothetical protein|nr:hypothetical protein [Planctomycetota bacterium]
MRPRFADLEKIRALARLEPETLRGRLKSWYDRKYEAQRGGNFEDQTKGGLLREFFCDAAHDLSRLRGALADGPDPDAEARIADLERLFSERDDDLQALDADESLENWCVPRRTGDPVADEWERQIARGEMPDLDD